VWIFGDLLAFAVILGFPLTAALVAGLLLGQALAVQVLFYTRW
jgi:hypothetical protein